MGTRFFSFGDAQSLFPLLKKVNCDFCFPTWVFTVIPSKEAYSLLHYSHYFACILAILAVSAAAQKNRESTPLGIPPKIHPGCRDKAFMILNVYCLNEPRWLDGEVVGDIAHREALTVGCTQRHAPLVGVTPAGQPRQNKLLLSTNDLYLKSTPSPPLLTTL